MDVLEERSKDVDQIHLTLDRSHSRGIMLLYSYLATMSVLQTIQYHKVS